MEKKQTHVTYGVINGIVMILTSLVFYLTGLGYIKYLGMLTYLPFIVVVILNAFAYSKANDGYVTYGNIYGSCFKAVLITTLFMVAWGIITLYAFPEMKTRTLDIMRTQMAQQANVTDDMIENFMSIYSRFWGVIIIVGSILGPIIMGAIISVIAAALPAKKVMPFSADNF